MTEPTEPIDNFFGKYRWLSNFYIEPDGSCVEVEYQQAKCMRAVERNRFLGLTPTKAKRLGRLVELRADWEKVKIKIMRELVLAKFRDHIYLQEKLLATDDRKLIEGNNWGDHFWGQVSGVGENWLGKILMDTRAAFKTGTVRTYERLICQNN